MSEPTKQPTILVKKSDGTSVRMTLSEFAEYKKKGDAPTANSVTSPSAQPAEKTEEAEKEEKKEAVNATSDSSSVRVPQIQEDSVAQKPGNEIMEAPAHEMATVAPKLPAILPEEPSPEEIRYKDLSPLPGTRDEALQKVLKKVSFEIRPELQGRAASLVQSRIKGIRNDAEITEYATREEERGGLGLNPEDAAMFLMAIKGAGDVAQKMPLPKQRPAIDKPIRPLPKPTAISKTGMTVPIRPVQPGAAEPSSDRQAPPQRPQRIPIPLDDHSGIAIPRTPTGRPLMYDVVPVAPAQEKRISVGPVEELRTITLADFRRLGKDTAARLPVLLQKFSLLKKDSYLLFLEAREAWVASPLFRAYQEIVMAALQQHKTIEQILGEQSGEDQLTVEEFEAVARVGKSIES